MDFTKDGLNCLKCHHRHQDNGNCTAVGGFCTAVPAAHCPLIPELIARAEVAEAMVEKYKYFFDDVAEKPNCNTCADQECTYRPKPGQITRFNCPLWRGPEDKRRNEYEKTDNG